MNDKANKIKESAKRVLIKYDVKRAALFSSIVRGEDTEYERL